MHHIIFAAVFLSTTLQLMVVVSSPQGIHHFILPTVHLATNNNASGTGGGGVMNSHDSSFSIVSSIFTENSVLDAFGGVIDTSRSSFSVISSSFTNNAAVISEPQIMIHCLILSAVVLLTTALQPTRIV